MSVLLCLANLIFCIVRLRECFRARSMAALFWASAIGFVAMPMAMDSLLVAAGRVGWMLDVYYDMGDGGVPYVDDGILSRAGAFALGFNGMFWLAGVFLRRVRGPKRSFMISFDDRTAALLYWILVGGGWLGLGYMVFFEYGGIAAAFGRSFYEYGFLEVSIPVRHWYLSNLSALTIILSGYGLLYGLWKRKTVFALAGAVPSLAMGLVTGQRPWLVALGGAAFCYVLHGDWLGAKERRRPFRLSDFIYGSRVAFVLCGLVTFVFVLNFTRTYRTEAAQRTLSAVWDAAVRAGQMTAALRDSSVFVMYWVFDNVPERLATTDGLSTGNVLSTLLHVPGRQLEPIETAGSYLAWHRNQQRYTTLHPTFYGWSMCDLGWWGVLWGYGLGCLVFGVERLAGRRSLFSLVSSAPLAVMIIVAMRGSVPYGVIRGVYGIGAGAFCLWAAGKVRQVLFQRSMVLQSSWLGRE